MEFVSVSTAAKKLRCSDETVRRYIISGELDGVQRVARGWWDVSVASIERKLHKPHTHNRETLLVSAEYGR